jgi:hypothetical protein
MVAIIAFALVGCPAPNGNEEKELTGNITITPTTATTGTELTAAYSGSEAVAYRWNKDGTAINGATAQTYTPSQAGTYTVTVNLAGYKVKTSAAVVVTIKRDFTIIIKKTVDGEEIEIGIAVKDTRTGSDDENLDELGIIATLEGGFNYIKLTSIFDTMTGRLGFVIEVEDTNDYSYFKAYSATKLGLNFTVLKNPSANFNDDLASIFEVMVAGPYPQHI